jgi:hypothetical protein
VLRTIAAILLALALFGYLTGAAQLVPLLFEK